MLQINYIRQNVAAVKERLMLRNFANTALVDELVQLDEDIRKQKASSENLQAALNLASKEIGGLMAKGDTASAEAKRNEVATLKEDLAIRKTELQQGETDFHAKI